MALCTIEGCGREHDSNGYCSAHWQRWRNGDRGERLTRPLRTYSRFKGMCEIKGCGRRKYIKGMCEPHYQRYRKGERGEVLERPIRSRKGRTGNTEQEVTANTSLDKALSALDF